MKKEQFLILCRTNPEEIFKLVVTMGETISALMAQVETLNNQVEALKAKAKELKARLDKNSRNSNRLSSTDEFKIEIEGFEELKVATATGFRLPMNLSSQKVSAKKAVKRQAAGKGSKAIL